MKNISIFTYYFHYLRPNSLFSFGGINLKWNYFTLTATLLCLELASLVLREECLLYAASNPLFLP